MKIEKQIVLAEHVVFKGNKEKKMDSEELQKWLEEQEMTFEEMVAALFIMPIIDEINKLGYNSLEVIKTLQVYDDPALTREQRAGLYGWCTTEDDVKILNSSDWLLEEDCLGVDVVVSLVKNMAKSHARFGHTFDYCDAFKVEPEYSAYELPKPHKGYVPQRQCVGE